MRVMLQPFPLSILWVTKIQFTDSFANAVQGTSQPSFESQLPVVDMLWEKYEIPANALGNHNVRTTVTIRIRTIKIK